MQNCLAYGQSACYSAAPFPRERIGCCILLRVMCTRHLDRQMMKPSDIQYHPISLVSLVALRSFSLQRILMHLYHEAEQTGLWPTLLHRVIVGLHGM